MKEFLSKKGVGTYLSAVAALLAIIAAICFFATPIFIVGAEGKDPDNGLVSIFLLLGAAAAIVNIAKPVRYLEFLPVIFYLGALVTFIATQINLFSIVVVGIDADHFSNTFLITMIFTVVAVVVGLITPVFKQIKE